MRSLATMLGESLEEPIEFSDWRTAMVIDRATDKLRELIRAQAPPVAESAGSDTPRTTALWKWLEKLHWKKEMIPVSRIMVEFEDLERKLAVSEAELLPTRKKLDAYIENEAACCPEDVGFKEYIIFMESKLVSLKGCVDKLQEALAALDKLKADTP